MQNGRFQAVTRRRCGIRQRALLGKAQTQNVREGSGKTGHFLGGQSNRLTGLVQALSLWPGTSRSMACIVGAQLAGLPRAAAADFAFLLALPTLGTATLYELLKHGHELSSSVGVGPLVLGLVVSFAVGWLVIAAFLRYLRRFGLWPFALYRIALALLLLWLL